MRHPQTSYPTFATVAVRKDPCFKVIPHPRNMVFTGGTHIVLTFHHDTENLKKKETSPVSKKTALQVGVDSFAARAEDSSVSPSDSIRNLVRRIELADRRQSASTSLASANIIAPNFSILRRK